MVIVGLLMMVVVGEEGGVLVVVDSRRGRRDALPSLDALLVELGRSLDAVLAEVEVAGTESGY